MPRWQAAAALDQADRERRAGAFAEPHAEGEQRDLAEALEHRLMRALGREVAGDAVVDRGGLERVQHRRGGRRHIAVEHHGDALQPRRDDRAGDRRDLAAAEPAQHLERVVEMAGVTGERAPSPPRPCGHSPASSTPVPRPTQASGAPP